MDRIIQIQSPDSLHPVSLASANPKDSDLLRIWKNSDKDRFFHKKIITETEQTAWMEKYLLDRDNFMFIILYDKRPVGCIGFKNHPYGAEIYNAILGDKDLARRGIMSISLNLICSYILSTGINKVDLKVLRSNIEAQKWYLKNCFCEKEKNDQYILMELDKNIFTPLNIKTQGETL